MLAPMLAPVISFIKYILKGKVCWHFDVPSLRGKNLIFSEGGKVQRPSILGGGGGAGWPNEDSNAFKKYGI